MATDAKVVERPILFSAPMVRAILSGQKTVTRRIITERNSTCQGPWNHLQWNLRRVETDSSWSDSTGVTYLRVPAHHPDDPDDGAMYRVYPRSEKGERLWVREAWRISTGTQADHNSCVTYRDGKQRLIYWSAGHRVHEKVGYITKGSPEAMRWRPSIHMPRWASRLTLEIVSLRVERLHDITVEDAIAEGLTKLSKDQGRTWKYGIPDMDGLPGNSDDGWHWCDWSTDPRGAYMTLWDRIVKGQVGSRWQDNPWVWRIEFKRLEAAPC